MKACAYIIGPTDRPTELLTEVARAVPFDTVRPYESISNAEAQSRLTPVCFFLFAEVPDPRTHASVASAIRLSASRRIRFSPLIYFADAPQVETIRCCVNMGFDDVITRPFTAERVRERLGRQLDTPLVYYEAAGYFGPDRRGRMVEDISNHPARGTGGRHRRLEIVRTLLRGVSVLRDDTHMAA